MKIVGVGSSAKTDGNSTTLLRAVLTSAEEHGAEVTELQLATMGIGYCEGCLKCMATGHCCQDDGFEQIRSMLAGADGIVLSTPVFAAAPCARMKNFIDRLGLFEYMTGTVYGGKYFAAIATAKSFGADKTTAYLLDVADGGLFGRARISGVLPVVLRGGRSAAGEPGLLLRARRLGEKMVSDWEHNARGRLRHPVTHFITDKFLRPRIAQAIFANRENGMGGVYEALKRRGVVA